MSWIQEKERFLKLGQNKFTKVHHIYFSWLAPGAAVDINLTFFSNHVKFGMCIILARSVRNLAAQSLLDDKSEFRPSCLNWQIYIQAYYLSADRLEDN